MTDIEDAFGDIADERDKPPSGRKVGKSKAAREHQKVAAHKFTIRRATSNFSMARVKGRADAGLRRF
jgi:hypothetical protein